MNKLIPHIEYLLQSHDCVIVPGLGAILAHCVAPCYDDENECWSAPSRVFSFNPDLSRTDGLLAGSIARREKISIEAASSIVRKEAEELLLSLDVNHQISLGNVGVLTMDDKGLLSFTPGDMPWLSPEYIWLPPVYIKPLKRASELVKIHEKDELRKEWPYILRRCGQVAACIAVMLTLGWIVVHNLTYAPEEQFASMLPNVSSSESAAQHQQSSDAPVVLIMSNAPKDEVIENIPVKEVVNKEKESESAPNYYLIVASLASQAEADKFLRQNSDIHLGILAKDGRYRIYAASGNTAEEVLAASKSSEIASRYPQSWVCSR